MDYSYGSNFEKQLHSDIKNLIETGYEKPRDDAEFNDIALRLFMFQYENCQPYKRFCENKGLTPSNVDRWDSVPAIPTEVLKYTDIACFPIEEATRVFMTSGTKDPTKRGKSYRDASNMELMDAAIFAAARQYCAPDRSDTRKFKSVIIAPPPELAPESPAIYDVVLIAQEIASEHVFLLGKGGFDMNTFMNSLKQAEESGEPLLVIGASFGFIPVFDAFKEKDIKIKLPKDSKSIDGGGYKGRSREISKEEFVSLASECFGIPDYNVINLLGLTESASLYLDNVCNNKFRGVSEPRYKPNHPWSRTVIINPDTLKESKPQRMPKGELGVIRHFDLANKSTVMAIQTEDIGYEANDGFEIMERGGGIAGCSLAIEEFMQATK